jgi:hypothetical protein
MEVGAVEQTTLTDPDDLPVVEARESSNSHDSVDAVCESIYAEIFSVPLTSGL